MNVRTYKAENGVKLTIREIPDDSPLGVKAGHVVEFNYRGTQQILVGHGTDPEMVAEKLSLDLYNYPPEMNVMSNLEDIADYFGTDPDTVHDMSNRDEPWSTPQGILQRIFVAMSLLDAMRTQIEGDFPLNALAVEIAPNSFHMTISYLAEQNKLHEHRVADSITLGLYGKPAFINRNMEEGDVNLVFKLPRHA